MWPQFLVLANIVCGLIREDYCNDKQQVICIPKRINLADLNVQNK